jgi:hypothetical protein
MARTTYVSMVAVGLLAAVTSSNIRAFATDDCLLQPNRQTATGEHWYYRSDPANNRKCWHIGQSGTKPPQEASVTPSDYPTSLKAENAPSALPEQPDEQRDMPTNHAENFEQ